jgi:catechol 2,3-dioxygenase-like lactoylglutathione lyase family enzyme
MIGHKLRISFYMAWVVALMPMMAMSASHTEQVSGLAPFDPFTHRSNFVVADLDRALRIYRDILGFQVNVVLPVQEHAFMRTIFGLPEQAQMRIAFLSGKKGEFGHIGLTEVKGIDMQSNRGGPYPSVLILEVQRELEPLHEKIMKEGSDVSRIFDLKMPDRREFIFTDYDGNRVLIMRLKVEENNKT